MYYVTMFYPQVCRLVSQTEMVCPSPQISKQFIEGTNYRTKRSDHIEAELGFKMDSVLKVSNLTHINAKMIYYPDPVVHNFTEPNAIKKFKGEVLIFEVMIESVYLIESFLSGTCYKL